MAVENSLSAGILESRLDAQGPASTAIIGRIGGSTEGSTAVLPIIISFFNYYRDESKLEGRCRPCFDLRI